MKIIDRNGLVIQLENKQLFRAGQATIYKIKNTNFVAKIYHPLEKKKRSRIENKLLFMIDNPPFDSTTPQEIVKSIVWPVTTLYNSSGGFMGFSMPYINDSIEVSNLVIPSNSSMSNNILIKFGKFGNSKFFKQRLAICYNLASVLQVLHNRNQYVVVDLKPQNILINIDGKISLIDIDSIQVKSKSKIYHADAWTDEYCPPEFFNLNINPKKQEIFPSWDYFAFASVSYQLLFQLPAFAGTVANHTTLVENISKHYFAHGKGKTKFSVIPSPHNNFLKLDKNTRKLFIGTFDGEDKYRVDFTAWKTTLYKELGKKKFKASPSSKPIKKIPFTNQKKNATIHNTSRRTIFIISILALLMVTLFYSTEKRTNKIKIYSDIFNAESYFFVSKNAKYKIIDTMTMNNKRWEQRLIMMDNGGKIGWYKYDK